LLQQATSTAEADPFLSKLSLVLDAPSMKPNMPTTAYEAWQRLTLHLDVPWPLQLLVDAGSLDRYKSLFRFLLLVKRVQMELHGAWSSQTECGALSAAQRALLMPLWRLRANMAFFIDNLQYYLQMDVLETQWLELTRCATTTSDFEQLRAAHENALAALTSQCFLQVGSVAAALDQIFQLCLSLCRMLTYAEVGMSRSHERYLEQFATLSREFGRQSAFLFTFLEHMALPQASPHLAQLLLRLNFNHFFMQRSDS